VIHINADRVDFVYDVPTRKGQAVVNFGKGHEIGIQIECHGLPRQGKGSGIGHAPSPLPAAWTVEDQNDACLIVKDRNAYALAYVFTRRSRAGDPRNLMTRDEPGALRRAWRSSQS
jgi:hypothetical protein